MHTFDSIYVVCDIKVNIFQYSNVKDFRYSFFFSFNFLSYPEISVFMLLCKPNVLLFFNSVFCLVLRSLLKVSYDKNFVYYMFNLFLKINVSIYAEIIHFLSS